jgi:hypothetical protein
MFWDMIVKAAENGIVQLDDPNLTRKFIEEEAAKIVKAIPSKARHLYSDADSEATVQFATEYYLSDSRRQIIPPSAKVYKYDGDYNAIQVTIPDGTEVIADYCFCGCTEFTAVKIPDSVYHIGRCAFMSCTKLKEVVLPRNRVRIEDNAFCQCKNLEDITIRASLIWLGEHAFAGCGNLTKETIAKLVIDAGLASIEMPYIPASAFNGCAVNPSKCAVIDLVGAMKEVQEVCNEGKLNILETASTLTTVGRLIREGFFDGETKTLCKEIRLAESLCIHRLWGNDIDEDGNVDIVTRALERLYFHKMNKKEVADKVEDIVNKIPWANRIYYSGNFEVTANEQLQVGRLYRLELLKAKASILKLSKETNPGKLVKDILKLIPEQERNKYSQDDLDAALEYAIQKQNNDEPVKIKHFEECWTSFDLSKFYRRTGPACRPHETIQYMANLLEEVVVVSELPFASLDPLETAMKVEPFVLIPQMYKEFE